MTTTRTRKNNDPIYKNRFEEAIRVRDEGRFEEAERLLSALEEEHPEDLEATLVRAGVLFEMRRFEDARRLFARLVELQPQAELASRGLFHSLWKLGLRDEAFAEMKRYMTISDSEDYRQLLKDLMNELRE